MHLLQSFCMAVLLEGPSLAYLQALFLHFLLIFVQAFLIIPNILATLHLPTFPHLHGTQHLTIYIFSCLFVYRLALFTRSKLYKGRNLSVLFLVLSFTDCRGCHGAMCTFPPSQLLGILYTDSSQQSPSPGLVCS